MKRRDSGHYQIEIRDRRLRGGRLSISARTSHRPTARRREAAIRTLLDRGELELVERLRAREIHIAEVQRAVDEGDLDQLRRPASDPLTLGAVLDRVMTTVEGTLEEGSAKEYRTLQRLLLQWLDADFDISRLTRTEVEDWLHAPKKTNRDKPWSAGRQILIRALAGRVWRDAIEREREAAELAGVKPRITRNPWTAAETRGIRKRRTAFLQPEEWRRLISKVEGYPHAAFLALGCLAGLRVMEAAHLRVGIDLDLDAGLIRVQPREGEHAWRPKTDRSIRDVPIGAELRRILEEHIAAGYAGDVYLIRLPGRDRPISPPTLQDWTRWAFEGARIKYGREGDGLTYHSLRHTFASWLVQADVSVMKVAHLLGDTVDMVVSVYGHLMPQDYARAIATLDAVATGTEGGIGA